MKIDISQLEFIDLNLRKISAEIEAITGLEFTITSLYRIGDKGVHGTLPLRGMDVRVREKEIGEVIEDLINRRWTYDPNRPALKCAYAHGSGSNYHLHIQVHPNTIKK